MLNLNKQHPDFDMTKEVMAVMSQTPIEMSLIEEDLGITRESLNGKLNQLKKQFRINYTPGREDMAVSVSGLSWVGIGGAGFVDEAERYFDRVYGEVA